MPGKGAKERRKLRDQQRILDAKEREKNYLEAGGEKIKLEMLIYLS